MTSPDNDRSTPPSAAGKGEGAGAAPTRPSSLRWLLVIVPVLIILAAGAHVVSVVSEGLPDVTRWPAGRGWTDAGQPPEEVGGSAPASSDRDTGLSFPFPPIDIGPGRREKGLEAAERTGAGEPGPNAVPSEAAFRVEDVLRRIPVADPAEGAAAARMCAPCHPLQYGEWHRVGPSLWGVIGRAKASATGFAYSQAMRTKGGTWTYEDLAAFLHNPRAAVPGTAMAFGGIADAKRVADVIAYLRTLADNPATLPRRAGSP